MKKRKRLISLITVAALVAALLPASALASSETAEEEGIGLIAAEEEAVDEETAFSEGGGYNGTVVELPNDEPNVAEDDNIEGEDILLFSNGGIENENEPWEEDEENPEADDEDDDGIMMLADEPEVTDLTLRTTYSAEGGQEYDYYSFTPNADGMYYYAISGDEVVASALIYYDGNAGDYSEIEGNQYGSDFVFLSAETTYYIGVLNSGSYSSYEIVVWGIASGEQSITPDTEYDLSSGDMIKDPSSDVFFTFVPETTGEYTFISSGNYLQAAWDNPSGAPNEYYYSYSGQNILTLSLSAGTTYYIAVWPASGPTLSGTLTVILDYEASMIQYFEKSSDKTSAGSGETVSYTMECQVTVPFEEYSGDYDSVKPYERAWEPDDFMLTFHATLDDGLTLVEDSFVVKYYRGGSDGTVFTLSDDNSDGNILDIVSMDTADGDSFEITIDLTEMYWTEYGEGGYYINYFAELEDSYFEVTYSATLDENVTPGVYNNTAHVSSVYTFDFDDGSTTVGLASGTKELAVTAIDDDTYEDVSDEVIVPVDTYGLMIYKYDSASWDAESFSGQPDSIPDSAVPLAGAEFAIYDQDGTLIDTLVSDDEGCACSNETFADDTVLTLKEIKAPDGYEMDESLAAEGEAYTISDGNADSHDWCWETVGNERSVSAVTNKTNPTSTDTVKTDDTGRMYLWLTLMFVAAGLFATSLLIQRRRPGNARK